MQQRDDLEEPQRHSRKLSGSGQFGSQNRLNSPRNSTSQLHFSAESSNPGNGIRLPTNNTYDDDDLLSPLAGPTRKIRGRVDSMSSMGSSVAPAALPQHRNRRQGSNTRPVSREDRIPESSTFRSMHSPETNLPTHHSLRSNLSDWQDQSNTTVSIGEGGLEAWLRSQASAGPPNSNNGNNYSLVRNNKDAVARLDGMSDTGRSIGAKSAGPRNDGSGSRKSTKGKRSKIPEWDVSSFDADAAGLAISSHQRNDEKGKNFKDWLGSAEIDSQVASERRRTRRELSPGTLSASGVRLREGVRRKDRGSSGTGVGEVGMSIDAMISSTRSTIPTSQSHIGTMSASPSMIGSSITRTMTSNAISERQKRSTLSRQSKKELIFGSPMRTWTNAMLLNNKNSTNSSKGGETGSAAAMAIAITSAIFVSIFVKWIVGLGGWSGRGQGPLYGDFEAQRHWIEITLHLPHSQWYYYDLQYWGLDYPPLTAHISRWCGQVASLFPRISEHFALDKSRGDESKELAIFMRASVLVFDILLYTPAILLFLNRRLQGRGRRTRAIAILTVLLQPSTILIDNGHFQYNTVMLGLAAFAFSFLYTSVPNPEIGKGNSDLRNRTKSLSKRVSYEYIIAAVFFSLSLCFKQMALYFAPAVFAIMLGRCVGLARIGFERGLICFTGIGLATIITFAITFGRWLGDLEQLGQIIFRIFPMARGLFEDKVSNIWCFLSVLPLPAKYKLKNALSVESLARLSLMTTLIAILLPCVHLFAAAAETVHIEMFLDEESKRQILASEKRQAEGSITAASISGQRPRYFSQGLPAPSEAGSNLESILGSTTRSAIGGGGVGGSRLSTSTSTNLLDRNGQTGGVAITMGSTIRAIASSSPSPAASVLPYALISTSLAFFLFGFQTHEKSILLPLLPMTLIMSVKADEWGGGAGKTDWEWAVLMNNVGLFSMWPLLQRDGLTLQYILLSVGWNWAIGYQPFAALNSHRKNFVTWLAAIVHLSMLALHVLEFMLPRIPSIANSILGRYPDLFAVLNVLLCTPLFGLIWLWSSKRQLEVGVACGIDMLGFQRGKGKKKAPLKTNSEIKTK